MRSRILAVAGISAAALAAAAAFAGTAGASSNHVGAAMQHTVASHTTPAKGGKACYSLTTDDSGVGIDSDNFSDTGFDVYDAAGAADFSVKKKCSVGSVATTGVYFNGSGPANSVNLLLYKNKKGAPGKVVNEQDNLTYTDSSGAGDIAVAPKTVKLKKGKYFVSVEANMTFAAGGEWGWELSSDTVGNMDMWENPAGGLGTPCTTWGTTLSCLGYGSDFMVTVGK